MSDDRRYNESLRNVIALVVLLLGIAILVLSLVMRPADGSQAPPPPEPLPPWLDADAPTVIVKDRHKIAPGAQRIRVPVVWRHRWCAVPVRVPQGQPKISYAGRQWKYDFGERHVEIEVEDDHVEVDYDD